jgi:hypothetical protein
LCEGNETGCEAASIRDYSHAERAGTAGRLLSLQCSAEGEAALSSNEA